MRRLDRSGTTFALLVLLATLPAGGGAAARATPATATERPADGSSETATFSFLPVRDLMGEDRKLRRKARKDVLESGDHRFVLPLVDALFFTPKARRGDLVDVLEGLTGEDLGAGYYEWVEHVGSRSDLPVPTGYEGWKRSLLVRIDPRYANVLYDGAPHRIRLEEVVWGGVPVEGIPALDDPPVVPAAAAELADDEQVFGAVVAGEARAWPVRVLSWHEMTNDRVGGEPVTLSFCTLCGSAVLFATSTGAGHYTFGTSGLLYRSNKLMVDRTTWSLWSNLTGEPVVGRLATSPVRLEILPLTRTTWRDWRSRHPDTTTLDVADLATRYAFRYAPGAADAARAGVSFPVPRTSDLLPREAEVFALRVGTAAKAYPLAALARSGPVNDRLGDTDVVVVHDVGTGATRAYRREGHTFAAATDGRGLVDAHGCRWQVGDEHLVPCPEEAAPPLPRLPGHLAFWFGWYSFFPDSEVWDGDAPRE